MVIDKVTMTGADDNTNVEDLVKISEEYPWVEWGILVSKSNIAGYNRFASLDYLYRLKTAYTACSRKPSLSCHLCGSWVRDLLLGGNEAFTELKDILDIFARVQINTHASNLPVNDIKFVEVLQSRPNHQYIIQYDGVNGENLLNMARGYKLNAVPLFDLSHGAGISPESWPKRLTVEILTMGSLLSQSEGDLSVNTLETEKRVLYCGYAGGLGPDNLESELKKMNEVIRGDGFSIQPIWIDMETKVRSDNDKVFDLDKVKACLQIAARYIP